MKIQPQNFFIVACLFGGIIVYGALFLNSGVHAKQVNVSVIISPPMPTTPQGDIDYYTLSASPVSVTPNVPQTGAASTYRVEFSTDSVIPPGGAITVMFAPGFQFTSLCQTLLSSTENGDINGTSPGIITITSLSCNDTLHRITVRTGGALIGSGERIRFFLQGIVNALEARDSSTSGYSVTIETRDESDAFLELKTSLPFFLAQSGSKRITGTLFNDNGAGLFGFAKDTIQNGSEAGLAGATVCLVLATGPRCQTTSSEGLYEFTGLIAGTYTLFVPSPKSGDVVGGPYYRDVKLSSSQSSAEIHFPFSPAERIITVIVAGIPASTNIDISATRVGDDGGGRVVRLVEWNGEGMRTVSVPVSDGGWDIGVGAATGQDPSLRSGSVVAYAFMIPKPQHIEVAGSGLYVVSFPLRSAVKMIRGRVIDGSGSGIPNVFLSARPTGTQVQSGGDIVGQSSSSGYFQLFVASGTYTVLASMPGMPVVNDIEVSVHDDSGNSAIDNNATADVYKKGVLIKNDGDGGDDNFIITVAKGERSISGRMLDELGGPLAYAHVSAEQIDATGKPIGALVKSATSITGLFTLFVKDGSWRMRGSASGYGELTGSVITVAGKDLVGQDLKVVSSDFGRVDGNVAKAGKAVSGAIVGIFNAYGGNTTTTDEAGNYSLRVRRGTEYSIDVFVQGSGQVPPIEHVTVGAGATISDQNFSLQSPGTIVVTIPNVSDAVISALNMNGEGDSTAANTTPGTYTMTVSPGSYTVSAQSTRYGSIGEKKNILVNSGQTVNIQFTPSLSYTVSGSITSDSLICVNGASVSVLDTVNGRIGTATTNGEGAYEFSLSNGSYRMSVTKSGCVDDGEPLSFVVKGADRVLTTRTITRANARVSGRAMLLEKNVAMETRVAARSSEGVVVATTVDTSKTDTNNYTLNLTPGTWIISSRADGYVSSAHTITVMGESTTLNLSMSEIPGYTPTEQVITPVTPSRGGIVKNSEVGDEFSITIPAGALGSSSDSGSVSTKVTSAIITQTQTAQVLGGRGIEITPTDASGNPISTLASASGSGTKITIPYALEDVSALGGDETKLMLAVWSEEKQQWEPLATTVDTVHGTLTAIPTHFSVFAPILPSVPIVISAPSENSSPPPQSNTTSSAPILGTPLPVQTVLKNTVAQDPPLIKKDERLGAIIVEPTIIENQSAAFDLFAFEVDGISPVDEEKSAASGTRSTTKPPTNFFEVVLSVDEKSRTVTRSGDVVIHGTIKKTKKEREKIPVRFVVRDAQGKQVFDVSETIPTPSAVSFSKAFHLNDHMKPGYYTIGLESVHDDVPVSFSQKFHVVERLVAPPLLAKTVTPLPHNPWYRSTPATVIMLLLAACIAGFVYALGGISLFRHL